MGHQNSDTMVGETDYHRALAHPVRREVMAHLEQRDGGRTTINQLSTHLASKDANGDREQMEIRLHHSHLPKLEALGVLDYEFRTGTIRFEDPPVELEGDTEEVLTR